MVTLAIATVILTRARAGRNLRTWEMRLPEWIATKRAAFADGRKLAVIMHAMLQSGELFEKDAATA